LSTQTQASEALKIDKGQLSRWENESPRPTLENLGRVLAGYGATVSDLAVALGGVSALITAADREPTYEELIKSLAAVTRDNYSCAACCLTGECYQQVDPLSRGRSLLYPRRRRGRLAVENA